MELVSVIPPLCPERCEPPSSLAILALALMRPSEFPVSSSSDDREALRCERYYYLAPPTTRGRWAPAPRESAATTSEEVVPGADRGSACQRAAHVPHRMQVWQLKCVCSEMC